ncbi:uncharacterized protein FA14DRAFT_179759 [Meira miltonrushii]|uniref:HTH La-type RNA-binding domain-containing protein n=1 Tax=Meira miltonrushii TaxID=1280837 RepID=A0A316VFP0_9BASI|nr:uncharacterized protein FA14DRAFT_179759 [Meira miltonrushii]PWN36402.1 hypothetical protein FA14DRAFT_179759 [Meira miltonrushii]
MPHPSPVTATKDLSSLKWSDCLNEDFTEESVKEIDPREHFFDLSLKRLLSWQAELLQKEVKEVKEKSLTIKIPPNQSEEMSWSSAATGKPQLSYAERLRRAKEGSKATANEGVEDGVTQDKEERDVRGKDLSTKSTSNPSLLSGDTSKVTSSDISPSLSSYGDTVATSSPAISSSGSPSLAPPSYASSAPSTAVSAPVPTTQVNIWEARRLQLQEQTKKLNEAKPTADVETDQGNKVNEYGSADAPKLNGEAIGANAKPNESQASPETSNRATEDPASLNENGKLNSAADGKAEEKQKAGKASKKKKQSQNSQAAQPPLISDASNWPSPNMAKEKAIRNASPLTPSQDIKSRQNSSDESRPSTDAPKPSPSPLANGSVLDQLDVEVLHPSRKEERQRKGGKQWIAIVPTLTHSVPPNTRPTQQQKRSGKNQGVVGSSNAKRVNGVPHAKQPFDARSSSDPQSSAPRSRLQRNDEATQDTLNKDDIGNANEASAIAETSSNLQYIGQFPQFPQAQIVESGVDSTKTGQPVTGQRRKSGTRTPRGARGRGGSKRSSDSEANNANTSADTSQQGDVDSNSVSNAQPSGSSDRSAKPSQRRDTLPNTRKPPSGPRFQNQGGGGSRRSTIQMMNGLDQQYYDPYMQAMHFGGPPPPMFAGGPPPFGHPGPSFAPQFGAMQVPILESTPVEFAPKGNSTSEEPTSALLWQIEFYFSHQNLQGDFYLRKVMDSQGYVTIEKLAAFNRVKRLSGENIDLIRDTIRFSKVLQLNEDASKVRKAFGWEPYVLVEGQHAQQWQIQPPSIPQSPYMGSPPAHPNANAYPLPPIQFSPYGPPEMIGSPPLNGAAPPLPMRNMPYPGFPPSMHYGNAEHIPPHAMGFAPHAENGARSPSSAGMDSLAQSAEQLSISGGSAPNFYRNNNDQAEEDEEDSPLGVVAATGLGGTLMPTNKKEV